jgi:serine protease Do
MARTRVAVIASLTLGLSGCGLIGGQPPVTVTVTPTPSTTSTTSSMPTRSPSSKPTHSPSPAPTSLQQAFNADSRSIVRLEVASCEGYGTGSAFLIAPDLVVTAGHVLAGSSTARAVSGTTVTHATLVGYDPEQDVALARLATPLLAPPLKFATMPVKVGDPVATIGFTLGGQLSFHAGSVNGLGRKASIEGRTATDLLEHDTAALPGDSGAPLVNTSGQVVGIHDAGITEVAGQRLAVSAHVAEPLVDGWRHNTNDLASTSQCDEIPNLDLEPLTRFGTGDLQGVHTLWLYVDAINNGDYARAAGQFVKPIDPNILAKGSGRSSIEDAIVQEVTYAGRTPTVWMEFTSHQPAGQGPSGAPEQTCTVWSLNYTMGRHNGLWLINTVAPHQRPGHEACP